MNPSVTAYFNAEAGHIGYVSGARTARFAFTTPASGATSLSFHTADFSLRSPSGNDGHSTAFGFRFALTTDENAYNGYVGGAGIAANAQIGAALSGSLSQNLQPNTTYYLFLFPSSTIYCDWYIESLSVTLMGVYVTASSLSAEDGAFGHPLSISLSRSVNGVTHTVTASCAGRTELLARQTEEYPTLSWTPALETYGPLLPEAASAQATLTVETFLGGSSLGSRSCTVTLRFLAEDVGPRLSDGWVSLSPYPASAVAGYIQGQSQVQASFDESKVSFSYGASLRAFCLETAEERIEAAPWRSGVLTGETRARCTVTDSRGLTADRDFTVTPMAYAPPSLSGVQVYRCDSAGAPDEGGNCVAVRAELVLSPLDGQNSGSLSVQSRLLAGAFGEATSLSSGERRILTGFSPDRGYELRLEAGDILGGTVSTLVRLPGRKWAMKFRPDGEGVAFGKAAEYGSALELPEDWTLRFGTRTWLDLVYPVGSLYFSAADTDPGSLFGGTWQRVKDRFLLAAGDDFAAGTTGGEAAHALSLAELPAETVPLQVDLSGTPRGVQLYMTTATGGSAWPVATYGEAGMAPITTVPLGEGQPHNNLPPYLTVNVWQRVE